MTSSSAETPAPGRAGEADEHVLATTITELSAEISALHADRARRRILDLATGVLTDQMGTSPDEAADHLVRLAVSTGLGAADLAADIVNAAAGALVVDAPEGRPPETSRARRARRSTAAVLATDSAMAAVGTLLEGGLRQLGVRSVFLWRRSETDCLELVGHGAVSRQEAAHWQWVPPEGMTALHRVVAGGEPLWLPEGTPPGEAGLPGSSDAAARALVPLRRDGRVCGVLLAAWGEPTALDEPLRTALTELSGPAALVLDWDTSRSGGPHAVAALLDLAPEPAAIIDATPGSPAVVAHLNEAARRSVPRVHDPVGRPVSQVFPYAHDGLVALLAQAAASPGPQYAVCLPEGGTSPGSMAHVRVLALGHGLSAVMWDEVDRSPVLGRVLERLERVASFEDDLVTGRSRWSDQAYPIFGLDRSEAPVPLRRLTAWLHPGDADALRELLDALTEQHEGAQALVRVIRADGGVRHVRIAAEPVLTNGTLSSLAGVYQDVSAQHRTEVALSASFDRLNAVQAQAVLRNRVVLQLQQTIVPEAPVLETAPGLEIAARYRPAAEEYRVGGDWYDVQSLPDGRVLVTVGDIAGHGIAAATCMVALRGALHGFGFTGRPPGKLMEWLNEVALHTAGQPTATVLCALYDPAVRTLRWTSAGHPPPLLVRDGRARLLETNPNVLLGALRGASYEETVTRLLPGDTLLLYTDGLVERRRVGLDESLAGLRRAAERLGPGTPDEQADQLMAVLSGDTDDDTSLVVVRVA
ncbi:SpoIIE family protein phosphatase [Streptomyces sp. NPDC056773]|uniref:SpoIIE family protein phosphatase n=1 Tax=unclassified Streptomyces TaxID=2593676 RepID=UPI0036D07AD5